MDKLDAYQRNQILEMAKDGDTDSFKIAEQMFYSFISTVGNNHYKHFKRKFIKIARSRNTLSNFSYYSNRKITWKTLWKSTNSSNNKLINF